MKKTSLVFIMAGSLACAAHAEVFNVPPHAQAALGGVIASDQGGRGLLLASADMPAGIAFEPKAQPWHDGSGLRKGTPSPAATKPLSARHSIIEFKALTGDAYRTDPTLGGAWQWLARQTAPVAATGLGSYYGVPATEDIAPEPAEWSMMLVGAGMVGFQVRRKQKQGV